MNYRILGRTGLKVSEIGLGCQSIGGGLYHKDDAEAVRTFRRAFDAGINFFDTADHYSQGHSERLLGRALRDKREKVFLATKAGMVYSRAGRLALAMRPILRPVRQYLEPLKISFHLMRASQKRHVFTDSYLTEAVHSSLRRLQTDYIDLFQLHKPDPELIRTGAFLETLERMKAQGKIRYYGIASTDIGDALLCLRHPEISSVQVTVNLLDRRAISEFLPAAREHGVGVIIRNPRAQGHLTEALGDITGETYARNQSEFKDKQNLARQFLFLAGNGRTLAQAAIRFTLGLEGVSIVLPRANNVEQLEENLGALAATPLSAGELDRIEAIGTP